MHFLLVKHHKNEIRETCRMQAKNKLMFCDSVGNQWNKGILTELMLQLSSSSFFRTSGSTRRPAVSSSRDPVITGVEPDPSHIRKTDASPGQLRKTSSVAQRSSPVMSSDQKRSSSTRMDKNFEAALKGIEGLSVKNDERLHY